ncbi:hypothetical protein PUR61_12670 [Streptomyces sp. BE20]|uniref:DUF6879 family protein n=1 Tax=Streptomyces sp. BE20 TaxID=3002525 RepID=UPI002E77F933|nr:DUF6879 family protein [Streptomyces sp. BE20]MEE1823036.1 hypothetical protein [Streptomyces sp. BE20]
MSRRLRYIGSNSGNNGCPTLYEDVETGEVLVQGDAVTDPDEVAQLRNVKDSPPTPGQRYLLDNAERNSAVGEDIRYLWRADADRLGLPAEDTWLFDSRVIALLRFDPDDDLTGVELITDPVQVARACQVRDAARHFATPHRAFVAGVPSGA